MKIKNGNLIGVFHSDGRTTATKSNVRDWVKFVGIAVGVCSTMLVVCLIIGR